MNLNVNRLAVQISNEIIVNLLFCYCYISIPTCCSFRLIFLLSCCRYCLLLLFYFHLSLRQGSIGNYLSTFTVKVRYAYTLPAPGSTCGIIIALLLLLLLLSDSANREFRLEALFS